MNQNDVQQFIKAREEMEKLIKLLPSQEALDRAAREEVDLDVLPVIVQGAIQKAEEAQKILDRYVQLLKNLKL